ncbi:hypothetical protein ACFQZ2_10045 [Streptomonospora algeriensis]|uniref:Uncharacterized protein n=1 Tax=Streptomonospora algeriensis TaxID=995084 RepID=A0ABW3BHC2_9ACTN
MDNTTPPDKIIEQIFYYLQLGIDTQKGELGGETALELIADLYIAHGNNLPDTREISDFKRNVIRKMQSGTNPYRLAIYILECFNYATDWEQNAYSISRHMRSLLQLFSDEFIDVDQVVPEPDRGQIGEIDEILMEPRPDVEPLRHVQIPDWIPESHWWWKTGRASGDVSP